MTPTKGATPATKHTRHAPRLRYASHRSVPVAWQTSQETPSAPRPPTHDGRLPSGCCCAFRTPAPRRPQHDGGWSGRVPGRHSCSAEGTPPLPWPTAPERRNTAPVAERGKLRSWVGPNGQYYRELPCPNCRGRGYTPCKKCGIDRSSLDCPMCNGKGIRMCMQCGGECVIWQESIDEQPWEEVRSSSPLKVKEDDEVDRLEIKIDTSKRPRRTYPSPSPEVAMKISRSLRSLNAKTGLFTKHMKIIHQDAKLHAQRVAAIKSSIFFLCLNSREQKVLLQQEIRLLKNKRHSSGILRIGSREALP
ncbi:uncharacterized protein [Triticum aestivum]|uniref:uncharacterized protein isoform X3 n=1 Tax=Triticum aestivum TaxID=4565 RepID=UPI001D03413B|nr:uncharacterized protein LOC123061726 isoform X3 [Triticum aestivum]